MKKTKIKNKNLATLISIFKGIEPEIFQDLNLDKRNYLQKLTFKEIEILFKTNPEFDIYKLKEFFYNVRKDKLNKDQILTELSSLIEYGKYFNELDDVQKENVKRNEIIQEVNHFFRIMGTDDFLREDKSNLSQEESLRRTWDFSRFLNLILERKVYRNYLDPLELESANPFLQLSPSIKINNNFCYLTKNNEFINIFVYLEEKNNYLGNLKDFILIFDKFLNKFSLKNSLLLFDYFLYLINLGKKEKIKLKIFALTEKYREKTILEISSSLKNLLLFVSNFENHFLKLSNEEFEENYIGKPFSQFSFQKIKPKNYHKIFVFLKENYDFIKELDDDHLKEIIEKTLPEKHKSLYNEFQNLLSQYKIKPNFYVLNIGKLKQKEDVVLEKSVIKERVKRLLKDFFEEIENTRIKCISLEAGHIHADRKPDINQTISLKLGSILSEIFEEKEITTEKFLMIDEYHVMNLMDYQKYLEIVQNENFLIDELIFESSPLIYEISIDLVKYLMKNKDRDYIVFTKGKNLYLGFKNEDEFIELLEDIENRCISGCILFDLAYSFYRLSPQEFRKVFNEKYNLPSDFSLHNEILKIYLNHTRIDLRKKETERFLKEIKIKNQNIDSIYKEINETPYLKIIKSLQNKRDKIIFNVLEYFYRPQQIKLNKFLKLLKMQPIFTLYFDKNFNLWFEK